MNGRRSLVCVSTVLGLLVCADAASAQGELPQPPPPAEAAPPSAPPAPAPPPPPPQTYAPTPPWPPAPPPAAAPLPADSGPATLFGRRGTALGGFGGFEPAYTRVAGDNAMLMCGEGALLINHSLSFGAAGCGLVTKIDMSGRTAVADDRLMLGYGGFKVRYHFFSRSVVNVALGATVGGGGYVVGQLDRHDNRDDTRDDGAFFVLDPEASVFLNLTRWARIGVSGSYRIVSGVRSRYLDNADLRGPTAGFNVQFGWF